MLKFFRRTRKKLIDDKKIGNYLLYAIGEIVLVVIGILIALAIDNSNDNRIKREKEQTYLIGLKNEFETSKIKLQELMRYNKNSYEAAKSIMGFMDSATSPSETELSKLFADAFAYDIFFNPNNSLLNEMINSGSLKDISNDTLRMRLTNWVANIDDIEKQEHMLDDQRNKVIDMFRQEGHSIRTILDHTGMLSQLGIPIKENPISNKEVLQSVAFENNILLFIITCHGLETEHYLPLLESLNSILALINSEIQP
ncbi:MAG: DUF6090 family protein [Allomuricauda sp.]